MDNKVLIGVFVLGILIVISGCQQEKALAGQAVAYPTTELKNLWSLDEGEGTKVYDAYISSSPPGVLGQGSCDTAPNSCPTWVLGRYGKALHFDGIDDYVYWNNYPRETSSTGSPFSVVLLVKPEESFSWPVVLLEKSQSPITSGGWLLFLQDGRVGAKIGDSDYLLSSANPLTLNQWHLVVMTFGNQQNNPRTLSLYVDGIPTFSQSISPHFSSEQNTLWAGSSNLHDPFKGTLDKIAIYNNILSLLQVKKLMCGDAVQQSFEECDDVDATSGDGCSSSCKIESGWSCTPDALGRSICTTTCGDGISAGTEQCDDGGTVDNDGCSALCQEEPDSDADGDGILDSADSCSAGQTGWTSDGTTDPDGDGCAVSEDTDDDGDSILDSADSCSAGQTGWTSTAATDNDNDGCKDDVEDDNDDNDVDKDSDDCQPLDRAINSAADEVCEGTVDNNCDRQVDEGCSCTNGDTQACGVGVCSALTNTCAGGVWPACDYSTLANYEATEDSCSDDLDNDCDGFTDVDDYADCDIDQDSVLNGDDNCPNDPNSAQDDFDGDLAGDACDTDDDSDRVDDVNDAFPLDAAASVDTDHDGVPDSLVAGVSMSLVEDGDDDGDGRSDVTDNCPLVSNPTQQDSDTDGVGDVCDTQPNTFNPAQAACVVSGSTDGTRPSTCTDSIGVKKSWCYCDRVRGGTPFTNERDEDNDCVNGPGTFPFASRVETFSCNGNSCSSQIVECDSSNDQFCSNGACITLQRPERDVCPDFPSYYYTKSDEKRYFRTGQAFIWAYDRDGTYGGSYCVPEEFQTCTINTDCSGSRKCLENICVYSNCGDGFLQRPEQCDDGKQCSNGVRCNTNGDCTGIGDELCKTRPDDGCSSTCAIEDGFSCRADLGETSICQESNSLFFEELRVAFQNVQDALDNNNIDDDQAAKETFITQIKQAVARMFR